MSIKYVKYGNKVMTIVKRYFEGTIRLNIFIEKF